ncbi:hypothetical protein I312_100249 [Cryptococcus bacillisporus CA1280]|uniref:F-box domain-containing protein n=1 Tax=Cryptococcus bacillisporus CA1280 TaxID=1296109 RepID=A0A0D0TSX3_CRYGA|nr:hypothetical protein I312_00842 [Cryptococcus bacillisporus CA1280]
MPSKRSSTTSIATASKRRRIHTSSVWTHKDDWSTLLSDSSLSTSSISTRPPRFRTFPTLTRCASDAVVRGFPSCWRLAGHTDRVTKYSDSDEIVKEDWERWWKEWWERVPPRLQEMVRDGVFKKWGATLSIPVIHELFIIPGVLCLPGDLLPAIAQAPRLKPLIPPTQISPLLTALILTHSHASSDVAVAGLIYHLPNLEVINLKGCTSVAGKTVKTILNRCNGLRKINLKGTKVVERGVKDLLGNFGGQLESFKIDTVTFDDIDDTFSSSPYPHISHLCLPGDILNRSSSPANRNAIRFTGMGYPQPRNTLASDIIQWSGFNKCFPRLTHLYLPGLLVPSGTKINTSFLKLIKIALGPRGPPVPISTVIGLIEGNESTLRSLHLGNVYPDIPSSSRTAYMAVYDDLANHLHQSKLLEQFRWQTDIKGTNNLASDNSMRQCGELVVERLFDTMNRPLKHLVLEVPCPFRTPEMANVPGNTVNQSQLETLEIPGAHLVDHTQFALMIASYPKLRHLDISGTTIDDDDMKIIIPHCKLLSRINLTSCRGIGIRHRRNIFEVT